MKTILAIWFIIAALAIPTSGQNSAPPAPEANQGVHFEVSTSFVKDSTGRQATAVLARLPVTPRWSFGYEQIQIPAASSQIYLGGVEIREVLGHLIHSSAAQINLSKIQVYADFGLGTKRDTSGNAPRFAFGVKGGIDFPLGTVGGGVLAAGASIGYIGVPNNPGGPSRFVFGNSVQLSPQLSIRF